VINPQIRLSLETEIENARSIYYLWSWSLYYYDHVDENMDSLILVPQVAWIAHALTSVNGSSLSLGAGFFASAAVAKRYE